MPPVKRMLRWFDRQSDELVGEEPLDRAEPEELSRLFNRPVDDPMYASYEVHEAHREAVQSLVSHVIRLDRHAYFVEADALPVAQTTRR